MASGNPGAVQTAHRQQPTLATKSANRLHQLEMKEAAN